MRIDRKKLLCAMLDCDMTQKDLAEKASVSRGTISGIASGKRCTEETAAKIAKALGVSVKHLIEG